MGKERSYFLFLLLTMLPEWVYAQPDYKAFDPQQYICYKIAQPVEVDGSLEEAGWQAAPWTGYFVDIEGVAKPEPRFRTRAKMLWDEDYFYFAAELEEPHIWGTLTERDAVIFQDNDFEIFIDPDGDTHRYYEFEINALNTIWDLLLITPYRDGSNPVLNSWDVRGIKTAVRVEGTLNDPTDTDQAWTVEIAMPWEVLKEQADEKRVPRPRDQWRVNFSRVEWQVDTTDGKYHKKVNPETGRPYPEDNWVWSPQGLVNMHYPELWGYVQFSGSEAEKAGEEFHVRPEESLKWMLRQLYYAQKQYHSIHQSYAGSLEELESFPFLQNQEYTFKIEGVSKYGYVMTATRQGDHAVLHIRQDGKVWQKDLAE